MTAGVDSPLGSIAAGPGVDGVVVVGVAVAVGLGECAGAGLSGDAGTAGALAASVGTTGATATGRAGVTAASAVTGASGSAPGSMRSHPARIKPGSTKRSPSVIVRPRFSAAIAVQSAPSPNSRSAIDHNESPGRTT